MLSREMLSRLAMVSATANESSCDTRNLLSCLGADGTPAMTQRKTKSIKNMIDLRFTLQRYKNKVKSEE